MIDPRFANTGAAPFVPGYGTQQGPPQYYHHHRHHRHHKHKNRNDESPVSRDESIHKVDHSQPHHFHQNEGVPQGGGYGVPYGAAAGFYPPQQQQQFGGANFGYANQYQGGFAGGQPGQTVKHHRHHRRHHHHTNEGLGGADQAQAVPEQLIGQRSSSVLGKNQRQGHSPAAVGEGDGGQFIHRRHHRRHHHHSGGGEHAGFGHTHQSRHTQHHTSAAVDGYGHINDELIFIERGDHSPHRQEPPPGYEYKGKIEVQGFEKEQHAQTYVQPPPLPPPIPQPVAAPPFPCPPGWTQAVLTPGSELPCPAGGIPYIGQFVQAPPPAQTGGCGYVNFGGNLPLPPNCQVVADYIVGSNSGGLIPPCGPSYAPQYQGQAAEAYASSRPTLIEVWQKRPKSKSRSRSPRRSRTPRGPDFDFDKFRDDILAAIERMRGRDGGTQTHPETRVIETRQEAGEVRVIVQPIQPVFYMPRQQAPAPQIAPAPAPQPSAPNVVYVPRNVYVPVIKPVFVPRERVIIRPQVIHVARPVLVDRPVPVTQRPIIIDRERPVPVPVRVNTEVKGGGSKIVREEYVYRDNLPVAYGGRCAEFAGGVNYGYVPAQQQSQYGASSTQETSSVYQAEGQGVQQTFAQSAQFAGASANGSAPIEVLDAAVNPSWQKTDQSSLIRRYGRPAYEIVHKSKEVEQQMYSELRHRSSSGVDIRSASSASYGSGSGIGVGDVGIGQY